MYWLSSLLIIASLFLANKAVQTKKNVELLKSQIVSRQQPTSAENQKTASQVSDAELIAAKQLIEALALRHKLSLFVKLDKGLITIGPAALERKNPDEDKATDTKGDNTYAGAEEGNSAESEKDRISQAKRDVLQNYDGLMDFLSSLTLLPYPLKYKELCIGLNCTTGFEVTIVAAKQG